MLGTFLFYLLDTELLIGFKIFTSTVGCPESCERRHPSAQNPIATERPQWGEERNYEMRFLIDVASLLSLLAYSKVSGLDL